MKPFAGRVVGLLLLCVGAAGCGDPATNDRRGYTKAPLEKPFLIIGGQERTAMDELGEPDRLEPVELDMAAPAAADTTGS